jgi:hypothetical protein
VQAARQLRQSIVCCEALQINPRAEPGAAARLGYLERVVLLTLPVVRSESAYARDGIASPPQPKKRHRAIQSCEMSFANAVNFECGSLFIRYFDCTSRQERRAAAGQPATQPAAATQDPCVKARTGMQVRVALVSVSLAVSFCQVCTRTPRSVINAGVLLV